MANPTNYSGPDPAFAPESSSLTDASAGAESSKDFLTRISNDLKRLQMQKSRRTGGVEGRILLNLAFVLGEHYTVYQNRQILAQALDPNKLSLVFNLIDRRMNKLIGRLTSIGGVFKANPDRRDPKAFAEAEIVDRLIKALDKKLDQPSRLREIFFWMLVGGVAFEHVPWIPNATIEPMPQFDENDELLYKSNIDPDSDPIPESQIQQLVQQGAPPEAFSPFEIVQEAGEVGSEILSPLNVFIDQGQRAIEGMPPDAAIYIAHIKTHAWIKENFGDDATDDVLEDLSPDNDLQIVSTRFQQMENASVAGVTLKDMIPVVQGSAGPDDPPMNVVVWRYQPTSTQYPHGRRTVFVPGQKVLADDDNPYDEIPIVDYHWSPVTINFWTKDWVTDMIAPQRFLNKRMSQLGEQSNAAIYDKLLLGPGLSEKDIPADYPGLIKDGLDEKGAPKVARLPPPELPHFFMDSIELTIKLLDDIAGGADLTKQTQFPGQMRGPMAVPMLQEILDSEWGPTYDHIGERLAKAKQMRLNRVKQFYPALRTMHYMDRDQRDSVFEFHTDKILRSGTNFNVTVERGSLLPELRALREARVRERLQSPLSILYIDERTGRLDKSKIASDLGFGDLGRDSREAQYRKLGAEIVARLWRGEPVPPVLPFQQHQIMMDELEAAMATTEFLTSSQPIQAAFTQRWQQHQQFMQQAAQQQQQTMMQTMAHQAAVQAAIQAASHAAAEAGVEAAQLKGEVANAARSPQAVAHPQVAAGGQPTASPPPGAHILRK